MTGRELKALRYKLNLSLSQASRQVEVSVSTWCRWEAGKQKIPEGAIKLFMLLNNPKKLGPCKVCLQQSRNAFATGYCKTHEKMYVK